MIELACVAYVVVMWAWVGLELKEGECNGRTS